ncbi:unnamed protein product, partial [Laminaria digitata]
TALAGVICRQRRVPGGLVRSVPADRWWRSSARAGRGAQRRRDPSFIFIPPSISRAFYDDSPTNTQERRGAAVTTTSRALSSAALFGCFFCPRSGVSLRESVG